MRPYNFLQIILYLPSAFLPVIYAQTTFQTSTKRGLVDIASTADTDIERILENSDITWYYNYGANPSLDSQNPNLTFVPMAFDVATSNTPFSTTIRNLIDGGTPVPFVLSYNEPDQSLDVGGSDISPSEAATFWKSQLQGLRALGVQVGGPAVSGSPEGFTWLANFFDACNGGCTPDFMVVHWYGDFEGLASDIGQMRGTYPNLTIWITEYGFPNQDLNDTQSFFNQSAAYFDRLSYVTHYSYFGSFRSDKSNIGPNVAMLDSDGQLTSIGSWYNGGKETNNTPTGGATMPSISSLSIFIVIGSILSTVLY